MKNPYKQPIETIHYKEQYTYPNSKKKRKNKENKGTAMTRISFHPGGIVIMCILCAVAPEAYALIPTATQYLMWFFAVIDCFSITTKEE